MTRRDPKLPNSLQSQRAPFVTEMGKLQWETSGVSVGLEIREMEGEASWQKMFPGFRGMLYWWIVKQRFFFGKILVKKRVNFLLIL